MGIQEEQAPRLDPLLEAEEACPEPEQTLTAAVRMEPCIINGQTSRERPKETTQPSRQLASEVPGKKCDLDRWTAENETQLRQLWLGNRSIEEIAQELETTPDSIYARVRIMDPLPNDHEPKSGTRNKTHETRQRLIDCPD